MPVLRCVAWDHPRCTGPVEASVADFRPLRPDLDIVWERRSLFSFGEGDIREQTNRYDLIIYDHPFVGEAARESLMLDLSAYISPDEIEMFRADSLGPSLKSYEWNSGLYALPIDAAAQTSAYRPDLLARIGMEPPRTFRELEEAHEELATAELSIVTPFKQIDLFCLVLTLSANIGVPVEPSRAEFLPDETFEEVLALIRRLLELSIPDSRDINPIAAFEMMSSRDDVAYAPFLFNYTNYARSGMGRRVLCTDIPGVREPNPRGACIGGAGIGVSALSAEPEAAVSYARFLCDPDYQAGSYVENGGQPASRAAWHSDTANRITNGFFHGCLKTMEASYLRPRFDGFMPFAREVGPLLSQCLFGGVTEADLRQQVRSRWSRALETGYMTGGEI